MKQLAVWLERVPFPVGILVSNDDLELAFAYTTSWLGLAGAHPISMRLPLIDAAFGDESVRVFFENLLPENRDQLDRIRREAGLEERDLLGILEIIGADVAGALSCLPIDADPVKTPGQLATDYDVLDEEALIDIVARLGEKASLPPGIVDKSSVAGQQRKIAVARLPDGSLALPKPGLGVPSTHILKVPDNTLPGEAFLEASCAKLAEACGLDVARAECKWYGQYEAILVERFDRIVTPEGMVFRLHQEDFAQALGLLPLRKYERYGSQEIRFSADGIAALLSEIGDPVQAVDKFLLATLFNIAIGNVDNHAKNHALLYPDAGLPIMAPLYDLVPVRVSKTFNPLFGFRVGNASCAEELAPEDFPAFAALLGREFGYSRFLTKQALPMLTRLQEGAAALSKPKFRGEEFCSLVARETTRLLKMLKPA